MTFPKKFRDLIDLTSDQVERPDNAWLVYAVCACEEDSCGWQGWIIDGVFRKEDSKDVLVPSFSPEACPNCGKSLFRTEVELKFVPSEDQAGTLVPGVDYEVGDIEYSEGESKD